MKNLLVLLILGAIAWFGYNKYKPMRATEAATTVSSPAAASLTSLPAQAAAEPALGSPTAAVTLVEYGSLTCDYCVKFHREVMPHLKRKYIDTGRVRYIFRDFPTSAEATRGAVAARCVRPEAYYPTLDALFWSVGQWSRASDVDAALEQEAAKLGLSTAEFRMCLKNPASQAEVARSSRQSTQEFDVLGTPTFLINGRIVHGTQTLEQMEAFIANVQTRP